MQDVLVQGGFTKKYGIVEGESSRFFSADVVTVEDY